MQDPDTCHQQDPHAERFAIGFAARTPSNLHLETVDGGFIVHATTATGHGRSVTETPAGVLRLVRAWLGKIAPPKPSKEPAPEKPAP